MKAESVTVNDFNGAINFSIKFERTINIIAGENGTGKTRLLQALKGGNSVTAFDSESYAVNKVFAINPKRNSERRELNQIVQQMRRDNKSYANFSSEAVNKHFNNGGFDSYSSFGELFLYYFDKLDRAGGDRIESMNSVVSEFNSVIESVFSEYKISAKWDESQGLPMPTIKKREMEIPITGLSCGEAELFSLALNLYALREQFDIFLIDEPETHLNWHLEKMLFSYLEKFSIDNNKQLIIATHSRVIVDPDFKGYSQFLYWGESGVSVTKQLPQNQLDKLLEDAFETLKIGGFEELTIFCEDASHKEYFDALLSSFSIDECRVTRCGDSSNVKSLYRKSISDGGWNNTMFVVDGDGQGRWKEAGDNFFQLQKYCIENFGLNIQALSKLLSKSDTDIKNKLIELLRERRNKLFGKSKSLDFLVELLDVSHITQDRIDQLDGSEIFNRFIEWAGYSKERDFWEAIFQKCADEESDFEYQHFVDENILKHIEEWANKALQRTLVPRAVEL